MITLTLICTPAHQLLVESSTHWSKLNLFVELSCRFEETAVRYGELLADEWFDELLDDFFSIIDPKTTYAKGHVEYTQMICCARVYLEHWM